MMFYSGLLQPSHILPFFTPQCICGTDVAGQTNDVLTYVCTVHTYVCTCFSLMFIYVNSLEMKELSKKLATYIDDSTAKILDSMGPGVCFCIHTYVCTYICTYVYVYYTVYTVYVRTYVRTYTVYT